MSDGSTFVGVSLPPDEKSAVDEWRRHQPEIPTRPKAIRELVRQALRRDAVAVRQGAAA
jgi:hypothetical protein